MHKGKKRADGTPIDEEIAFQLQAANMDLFIMFLNGRKTAGSIERELESDTAYLDTAYP